MNGRYFLNYFKDTGYILTQPIRWEGKDWLKFSAVMGGTFALVAFDEDLNFWVRRNRNDPSNTISDIFEPLGRDEITMPWSPVVGFYLYGAIAKNDQAKRAALLAMESYIITGFFTQTLKRTVKRKRPFSTNTKSFPSGHTTSVFAIASTISAEYKNKKWVTPVLYGVATLTSLSRINDLKHWGSDVFFGAMMGHFVGRTISKIHTNDDNLSLMLVPGMGSPAQVGFTYKF